MSSTEANYSFTTKINGDLFTVRGDTWDEFHTNLAQAGANLNAFINDVAFIQAGGHAAPVVNTATPPASSPDWAQSTPPSQWATPTPPPAATAGSTPTCIHGPRNAKSGNGAKGEWKAWMCPTPKGTPNQCQPVWVQKNSAEWAAFPA